MRKPTDCPKHIEIENTLEPKWFQGKGFRVSKEWPEEE